MSRNDDIVTARATGETMPAIARRYGITRQRVAQILDRKGAPRTRPTMFPRDERLLLQYIKAGLSAREIAICVGKCQGTIHRALRDLDLKIPKDVPPHGDYNRYRRGCRCEFCRGANAERARGRRRRAVAG